MNLKSIKFPGLDGEYTIPQTAEDVGAATETFVLNKIAEAQLGGSDANVDLSGYATKDDIAAITATSLGAVSKTGDTMTNNLVVEAQPGGAQGYVIKKTVDGVEKKLQIYLSSAGLPSFAYYDNGTAATRMVLGNTNVQFTKPVALNSGGTGATTAQEALANLGAASADSIGTNKVFNKLTDLGITTFPTTMQAVANAMPNNSTLMLDSRDIISGGTNEISDLGINNAGMFIFMRGNSNARLSLLHIYGASSATTAYMNFGCYAAANDQVVWIRGERQNGSYPDCRYRTAEDGTTEYINPPMLSGTEYRTTERWNGKPVYTKLLVCTLASDVVGNTTVSFPHGVSNIDVATARIDVTTYNGEYDESSGVHSAWVFPYYSYIYNQQAFYVEKITDTEIKMRAEGGANSWDQGRTIYFLMKYTKNS